MRAHVFLILYDVNGLLRSAKKPEVINLITDEEDAANEAGSGEDDDDFVLPVEETPRAKPPPLPSRKKPPASLPCRNRRKPAIKVEGDVDADISALLKGTAEAPLSVADSDEEEAEVSNLLME